MFGGRQHLSVALRAAAARSPHGHGALLSRSTKRITINPRLLVPALAADPFSSAPSPASRGGNEQGSRGRWVRWFGIPTALGVAFLAVLQLTRTTRREQRRAGNGAAAEPNTWQDVTVDKVVKLFEITTEGMGEVASRLTKDFNKGLEREGDDVKVKMLITYVHSLPDGSEEGDFLGIDLGGNNFRVLQISTKDRKDTQIVVKTLIDDKTKQTDQETLFDFIAKCVADFIKEKNITSKMPLGFTFSFPVHQISLTSGTLVRWTKGFNASGAVGKDPVKLLHDAFQRRGGVNVDVVALLNDTTGTQLAVGYNDPDCHMGLILGTGCNACYMENLDRVGKFQGDRSRYSQVIINTEWGAFGDDGTLENWLTEFDKELDKELDEHGLNPGEQTFEKCIAGMYLGEISRLALQKLVKAGQLFGGKSSVRFDKFEGFETKCASIIEGSDNKECQRIFREDFGIEATDADCNTVRRVCEAVSTRAARLAAAGIVALVRKINKLEKCTVAVDGSLYKDHTKFHKKMRTAIDELVPGNGITIKVSEDGSGRGAAIVAAVACRLKDKGAFKQ